MNKTVTLRKNVLIQNSIFAIFFVALISFLVWKCHYGIASADESFYLTIPYRLCMGDGLFVDEWHLTQMSGFILYPFVSLYLRLNGSMDGAILFARYLYVVFQGCVMLFVYLRLKKWSWIGAVAAGLYFGLFAPFNIMALSYNTMGSIFLLLSLVIITSAEKHLHFQFMLSGMFFALAVLCHPYLLLVFIVYAVVVCIKSGPRIKTSVSYDNFRGFVSVVAGCLVIAVVFFLFLLSRATVPEIIEALPYIMQDPEHTDKSLLSKLFSFCSGILLHDGGKMLPAYALFTLLWLVCVFDKSRQKRRAIYFFAACLIVSYLMLAHFSLRYVNYIMWSINVLPVFCLVLSLNPIVKKICWFMWLPGMLYTLCVHFASNQIFYGISAASVVPGVASIFMLMLFTYELFESEPKKLFIPLSFIVAAMLVFQLSTELHLRYKPIFWDTDIETQTRYVNDGINSGLYVSEAYHSSYYNKLESIAVLENYAPEKVLYLSSDTWYYLCNDYEMAAFSAWLSGVNEISIQRLFDYYALRPNKIPDLVYLAPADRENAELFCATFNYKMDVYDNALILLPNAQ